MTNLISTTIINTEVSVGEDELRARLEQEVLEGLGLLDEAGNRRPGITVRTLRGEGGKGGYRVQILRDMTKDTTPRLAAPAA